MAQHLRRGATAYTETWGRGTRRGTGHCDNAEERKTQRWEEAEDKIVDKDKEGSKKRKNQIFEKAEDKVDKYTERSKKRNYEKGEEAVGKRLELKKREIGFRYRNVKCTDIKHEWKVRGS